MKLFFRPSIVFLMSVLFVSSASAIEFQGGILGKLFNGEGCSRCEKEEPAPAPEPTCECPAPEPEPAPAPAPCPCVVEAAPAPEPEPAPAPTIIYCCPVVEAAPAPAPETEALPCCESIVSESNPVVVEAEPEMATEPIETIISERVIYDGPVLSTEQADEPMPASAPTSNSEPTTDIFGPAAKRNVVAPIRRLVFTPKNGWSTKRTTTKGQRTDAIVKTATLKRSPGNPTFKLTFTTTKASNLAK